MTSAKCTTLELEFTTNREKHHKYKKAPFRRSEEQLWHHHNHKIEIFSIYSIYLHEGSTFTFNAEMAKTCYLDTQFQATCLSNI